MGDDAEPSPLGTIASTVRAVKSEPGLDQTVSSPGKVAAGGDESVLHQGPRYELRGVLGIGGMGRVEKLFDEDLLREVAVKQLKPGLRDDKHLLAQFLWEARVTASLDHPNIVPVHDLGTTGDGTLYFTMKLARGDTLAKAIERVSKGELAEQWTLPRRLRLFLQLCNAVAFAHGRGVLHRDLKPGNVMLGEHGELLVTDWGLAVPLPGPAGDALRRHMPAEAAQSGSGTPAYMSPEQARGEQLDVTSDVYSLGAVLFELVSLLRPIDAESAPEALEKVKHGRLRPLTGVSTSVAAVIHKAMALEPSARYPSVQAMADDIETVLDGRTPDAERASLLAQAARFYVSHDPAMSRLRVVDVDWWMLSAGFLGAACALFLWPWVRDTVAGHWWVWLGLCVAVGFSPTRRYLKNRAEHARAGRKPT